MSNKIENKTLWLETPDKQSIELRAEQLADWIKKQAQTDLRGKHSMMSSASLGHFGLKTAQDVIYFLKTPAGASIKAAIARQLAIIASFKEGRRVQVLEEMLFKRRLMAFFIFSVITHREAKARFLNEQIAQQLNKTLNNNTHANQPESSSSYTQATIDILKAYDAEIDYLNEEKKTYKSEKAMLEAALAKQEELSKDLEVKHQLYDEILKQLDSEFVDLEKHLDLTAQSNLSPEQHELKQTAMIKLQEHYTALQGDIEKQTDSITELLSKGHDEDARKSVHQLNCLHFKATFLSDMLAIAQGQKKLFDEEGQPVDSYSKAAFVLKPDRKIVKHEGQYYLIGAAEDLQQMGPEQKALAAKQYAQSKTELVSVKKMVLENVQVEKEHHHHQTAILQERQGQIKEHKQLLKSQLTQVQAARSIAQQALEKPEHLMQAPVPAFSNVPANIPKSSEISEGQSFRKIIGFLRENEPKMTRYKLNELCQTSEPAQKYVSAELLKIPASAPIPHTTMVNLLKNLERFGIDATKPSMTNIKSRTDFLAELQTQPSNSPTPFSMTPTPKPR